MNDRRCEPTLFNWAKYTHGKFISCSENVAELAGLDSPKQLIGKTDFDLIWSNRAEFYLEEEKIALSGQYCKKYQIQNTVNGSIKIVVAKTPLYNSEGKIIGTIGSSIDVTNKFLCNKLGYFDEAGALHLGAPFTNEILSKREVEVLRCILLGNSAKQIARHLDLSPRTIEFYIAQLKKKLQCKTLGNLIHIAIQYGLTYLCFE